MVKPTCPGSSTKRIRFNCIILLLQCFHVPKSCAEADRPRTVVECKEFMLIKHSFLNISASSECYKIVQIVSLKLLHLK